MGPHKRGTRAGAVLELVERVLPVAVHREDVAGAPGQIHPGGDLVQQRLERADVPPGLEPELDAREEGIAIPVEQHPPRLPERQRDCGLPPIVPGTPGLLGSSPDGPGALSRSRTSFRDWLRLTGAGAGAAPAAPGVLAAVPGCCCCCCCPPAAGPLPAATGVPAAPSPPTSIDVPAPGGSAVPVPAAGLWMRLPRSTGPPRCLGPHPPPPPPPPIPPLTPPLASLSRLMTGLTWTGCRRPASGLLPTTSSSSASVGELSCAFPNDSLSAGRAFQPPPFRPLRPPASGRVGWLGLAGGVGPTAPFVVDCVAVAGAGAPAGLRWPSLPAAALLFVSALVGRLSGRGETDSLLRTSTAPPFPTTGFGCPGVSPGSVLLLCCCCCWCCCCCDCCDCDCCVDGTVTLEPAEPCGSPGAVVGLGSAVGSPLVVGFGGVLVPLSGSGCSPRTASASPADMARKRCRGAVLLLLLAVLVLAIAAPRATRSGEKIDRSRWRGCLSGAGPTL
uniref:Uncharacterized protein n=1 Tax=Anopheles merus TaxID=30066 RepID=A0A182VBK6_ANOME